MVLQNLDPVTTQEWARVRGMLRSEVGEAAYRSWLKPLKLLSVDDGRVEISVPTQFMRDWVISHYGDRLRQLWISQNSTVKSVEIRVDLGAQSKIIRSIDGDRKQFPARGSVKLAEVVNSSDLCSPLDTRFKFSDYIVGKSNELAYAAARRIADSEGAPFNPLFLYGGVGLGKTHLMHAIAIHTRDKFPEKKVVYLTAEKFMYHFVRALRVKDTVSFKENFRSVDLLMIDDLQFINGKDATQEEFFHTFNDLVDNKRQVVIAADKPPSDLDGMEERLRSRLGCGLVADIHATSRDLRLKIIEAKAARLGTQIPPKVKEFLSHRIKSNVRELEGALNRVVVHSSLVGGEISLESCQEVLADLLRANSRRLTIEEIQKRVSEHFNIRAADMCSARRARVVARPRQVAMYLSKQLTARSLPEIGRKFGGRDHTTVMHAVKKVEELRGVDPSFDEDIDMLRRLLEN
ncbi:MAG: chromosomal replication initiator protein DnaA [Alphaproteobacteria bacterium]